MSSMGTGDVFAPQVAVDSIVEGLAGAIVLYGSPAVVVASNLGEVAGLKVNKLVDIPYFGMIPEFQIDVPENVGLVSEKGTETSEQARVRQAGVKVEWSEWVQLQQSARSRNLDPYVLFGNMITQRFTQACEKELIKVARDSLSADYINDASSDTITWDSIVDVRGKFGDEAKDVALISCHSKVKRDLLKLKDGNDRPLMVDAMNGAGGDIPRVQGVTLYESDLNYKSSANPALYDTLVMMRNSLALWHSMPTVEIKRDATANTNSIISWFFYIPYRYNKLPGRTRGGVGINRTR